MNYLWGLPAFIGGIFVYMFAYAKATKLREHHLLLEVKKEEKPLTLFFISDIHRRKLTRHLLSTIKEKVDAVIIGGDLAEKGVPLSRIEENVKLLSEIGPIYYIWGNNDREVGEQNMRTIIETIGGHILENDSEVLKNERNRWNLSAVDDTSSGNCRVEQAFSSIQPSDVMIFITHSPFVFPKAKKLFKPHVMIAGHTHGGQIRIGPLGMFKKGRLLKEDGRYSLISNGYGTSLVPLRLGARPECHILRINGTIN